RDELSDVDGARRLTLQRLQLLVGEAHVLVLRDLVSLHEIAPLHHLVADGTVVLVPDAVAALHVKQVERRALRRGRRVHPDRNRDQPERDARGSQRMWRHGAALRFWKFARAMPDDRARVGPETPPVASERSQILEIFRRAVIRSVGLTASALP